MKFRIDKCIVTPEGETMPRGFDLIINNSEATISVPSDAGDPSILYNETIPVRFETFFATYEDGTPVHIDDREVIGDTPNAEVS